MKSHSRINLEKYGEKELNIAYDFSKKVHKEFGTFVRAIVLFGSVARQLEKQEAVNHGQKVSNDSDIDILVVVDDVRTELTPELVEAYRIIMEKIMYETSPKLHVTSLKFSHFWEYARVGDPIVLNILRDGFCLLDTGFFEPLQLLLFQGRIRPSDEAVWAYYSKAPISISNSKRKIMQAVLDLYWGVIDSAHSALMKEGIVPGTPKQIPNLLQEVFVKKRRLNKKYVLTMKKFYELSKKIIYRDIKEIKGSEYDAYYREAKEFVEEMHKLVNRRGI